jgi:Xaa-Pro aminopeptidase
MNNMTYKDRIRRCCRLMKSANLDLLLLTKPSNMFYRTGD